MLPPDSGSGILSTDDWHFDPAALEKAITPGKTKFLFLNNPNNPVGKVFRKSELETIATLAMKYDLMVFSDEVYDRLVYPDSHEQHHRIGMKARVRAMFISSCVSL